MSSIASRFARKKAREEDGLGNNDNAVPFIKQDFQTLKRECEKSKSLFCDPTFPADWNSLGYNELGRYSSKTRNVEWKRPKELCSDPQFIMGGATRTDICQGALGDCWLLAAIASLTLDQELLARVVPPDQSFDNKYAGIFHFQFWQYGVWMDVVIDDRLPTREGKLLFVHSAEGTEFWSALLEKAYAKVHGCYEALSGGSTIEGFEDFTGGISETYTLKDAPPYLFKIIQKALGMGSLLGCSIDITSAYDSEAVTSLKLVKGHAYSITGAEEVHVHGTPVALVRIRNPWGQVEWTGPWSDDSEEWDSVLPEEKTKLDYSADDGEFWMAYSDLLKQFSKMEICNLTPDTLSSEDLDRWSHYQFNGMWMVGSTAGGCRNHPATFCSNPQFAIKLDHLDDDPHDGEDGCTFLVGLMQKDARKERRFGRDLNTIGFAIYQVPNEYKGRTDFRLGPDILLRQKAVAQSSTFINLREVCDRFKLPPGEYVIIPSTFEAHRKGSFVLRVFSEKTVATRPMEPKIRVKVDEIKIQEKDVDPHFQHLFKQISGNDSEVSAAELQEILNKVIGHRSDVKTDGFSVETCRYIISLLDRDGSGKLGLVEFHTLWTKIQTYLEIFKGQDSDNSGTMSSHEIREALAKAGFHLNTAVVQVVVSRYADSDCAIDFDCFVSCLIRLEMLFKMFKTLDKGNTGKIELDVQQELLSNPKFIVAGATRTDICQGALGDCWLLAAIASLTLNEEVLARVVPHGQNFEGDYSEIFHFQIWQYGEWVDVVIDDRLPTKNGELLFVHSAEGTEFWSALLEKAYAKINGCYEALSGGSTTEGFEGFTGGIAEVHELRNPSPNLFKILQKAQKRGSLMGCSIDITSSSDSEAVTTLKLVKGHAYSVTGAEEVEYQGYMMKLIRIRNPWGQVEWTGPWSDGSREWRQISDEDRERLSLRSEDGEFWMSFSDFLCHYSRVEICNLSPDALSDDGLKKWSLAKFDGNWRKGSTAGGCRNYPDTFWTNPQFVIKLDEEDDDPFDNEVGCSFVVGLIQKNRRQMRKAGEDMHTVGFAIYEVPEKYIGQRNVHLDRNFFLRHASAARSETFINLREVCNRFCLPPGEYLILPSTFQPQMNGDFCVRVFSEKQAEFQELDDPINSNVEEVQIDENDVDYRFKGLFGKLAGKEIKTNGFSLDTCRNMVNLLDKDGSGKLGMLEFKVLWTKIESYLNIYRDRGVDKSGTMSSMEMRTAVEEAGFKLNNPLHQLLVARYSDPDLTIDFDNFVCCLVRLESLFKTFQVLDKDQSGEVELSFLEWLNMSLL